VVSYVSGFPTLNLEIHTPDTAPPNINYILRFVFVLVAKTLYHKPIIFSDSVAATGAGTTEAVDGTEVEEEATVVAVEATAVEAATTISEEAMEASVFF
jgi:hypothetical protein